LLLSGKADIVLGNSGEQLIVRHQWVKKYSVAPPSWNPHLYPVRKSRRGNASKVNLHILLQKWNGGDEVLEAAAGTERGGGQVNGGNVAVPTIFQRSIERLSLRPFEGVVDDGRR